MDNVPTEVIYRHAFSKVAEFFTGRIEEKRRNGRVAVLVDSPEDTIYYIECNKDGYPNYVFFKTLHLPQLSQPSAISIESEPTLETIIVEEITIQVEQPLVFTNYYWQQTPIIFMWKGRRAEKHNLPIEKLNVSELLRVVQTAIKNREGLIVDEVLKNKIYK